MDWISLWAASLWNEFESAASATFNPTLNPLSESTYESQQDTLMLTSPSKSELKRKKKVKGSFLRTQVMVEGFGMIATQLES
jgi:hypothetical protein